MFKIPTPGINSLKEPYPISVDQLQTADLIVIYRNQAEILRYNGIIKLHHQLAALSPDRLFKPTNNLAHQNGTVNIQFKLLPPENLGII